MNSLTRNRTLSSMGSPHDLLHTRKSLYGKQHTVINHANEGDRHMYSSFPIALTALPNIPKPWTCTAYNADKTFMNDQSTGFQIASLQPRLHSATLGTTRRYVPACRWQGVFPIPACIRWCCSETIVLRNAVNILWHRGKLCGWPRSHKQMRGHKSPIRACSSSC